VKVLYRFLEGKDEEGTIWAVGMAYTGYRTNSPDKSYFMTIRSNKDWIIKKIISELSEEDIPNREIFHVSELSWSEVFNIVINDDNYEWTPDILLDERSDYLESLTAVIAEQRKTA